MPRYVAFLRAVSPMNALERKAHAGMKNHLGHAFGTFVRPQEELSRRWTVRGS